MCIRDSRQGAQQKPALQPRGYLVLPVNIAAVAASVSDGTHHRRRRCDVHSHRLLRHRCHSSSDSSNMCCCFPFDECLSVCLSSARGSCAIHKRWTFYVLIQDNLALDSGGFVGQINHGTWEAVSELCISKALIFSLVEDSWKWRVKMGLVCKKNYIRNIFYISD